MEARRSHHQLRQCLSWGRDKVSKEKCASFPQADIQTQRRHSCVPQHDREVPKLRCWQNLWEICPWGLAVNALSGWRESCLWCGAHQRHGAKTVPRWVAGKVPASGHCRNQVLGELGTPGACQANARTGTESTPSATSPQYSLLTKLNILSACKGKL